MNTVSLIRPSAAAAACIGALALFSVAFSASAQTGFNAKEARAQWSTNFKTISAEQVEARAELTRAAKEYAKNRNDEDAREAFEAARDKYAEFIASRREAYKEMRDEFRAAHAAWLASRASSTAARKEELRAKFLAKRQERFDRVCHRLTTSRLSGFGVAFDILSPAKELLLKVYCDRESPDATMEVGTGKETQFIYEKGYVWDADTKEWKLVDLQSLGGEKKGAWFVGKAAMDIELDPEDAVNDTFAVAYMCTWTGLRWKCGCQDEGCSAPAWQIQRIEAFQERQSQ